MFSGTQAKKINTRRVHFDKTKQVLYYVHDLGKWVYFYGFFVTLAHQLKLQQFQLSVVYETRKRPAAMVSVKLPLLGEFRHIVIFSTHFRERVVRLFTRNKNKPADSLNGITDKIYEWGFRLDRFNLTLTWIDRQGQWRFKCIPWNRMMRELTGTHMANVIVPARETNHIVDDGDWWNVIYPIPEAGDYPKETITFRVRRVLLRQEIRKFFRTKVVERVLYTYDLGEGVRVPDEQGDEELLTGLTKENMDSAYEAIDVLMREIIVRREQTNT